MGAYEPQSPNPLLRAHGEAYVLGLTGESGTAPDWVQRHALGAAAWQAGLNAGRRVRAMRRVVSGVLLDANQRE